MDRLKSKKISLYLTAENAEKMKKAKVVRGMTTSEFINHCCKWTDILAIGDKEDFAKAYCRLVALIDDASQPVEVRKEVEKLCRYTRDLLRAVEAQDNLGKWLNTF